ncbi:Filaggrin [Camelus dromedarius]|uniref:Filaggrin n=1 Tax=Camelus dromedarius TaxID=9838 RepID=A0A5N4CP22_CAMDR|nr:Filaggrin [Camelus dromedarius]
MSGQRTTLGSQTLSNGTGPPLQKGILSAGQRQGHRHEQQRDSSRHSGTGHRQTSTASSSGRPTESSVSQASDSDGSYEDAGRQTVTTHGRSGSSSRHQHGASHGQAGDSSRHSASHQGQRGAHRERDSVHGEGTAMSSKETAPDTQGLDMDKAQLCPVTVDPGNPVLARQATATAPMKMQGDKLLSATVQGHPYRKGFCPRRDRKQRWPETGHRHEHKETAPDTQGLDTDKLNCQASDSDGSYEDAGRQTFKAPTWGSHGQAGEALGPQHLIKGKEVHTERGLCPRRVGSSAGQRQGHRHEQQRDSSRHSGTGYGQSSTVSSTVDPGNPVLARQATARSPMKMQGDKLSVSQYGASHGQGGDSSRHSASHQGQRGAHRESDSVHGESRHRRKETTPALKDGYGQSSLSLVLLDTGIPVPVTPVTAKGIQKIHEGNLRLPTEDLGPVRDTNMGLPMAKQETALGTQRLIKGKEMHTERVTLSAGQRQGHRHEQQGDSSRHSGLDNKPQLRLLAQASDSDGSMKMQGDKTVTPMEDLGPVQGTNMGLPMAKQETALGTQHLIKGKEVHTERGTLSTGQRQGHLHEQQGDSSRHSGTGHRQTTTASTSGRHRESSVSQASDSDGSYEMQGDKLSRHQHGASHGQAGDSSRHSASHQGQRGAHRERDSVHGEDRGTAMSSKETAPDTQGLDMGKAQLCPVTVDPGNPVLARQATATAPMKMQGDKLQYGASHGQGGDSSRHSASHQGQRGAHRESDSQRWHKHRSRHQQERDNSRHSRTGYGQSSALSGTARHRDSSTSHSIRDNNMGLPMARQETALGTQRLIKGKEMHTERVTLSAGQRQGHRHEQQGDSSRHSGTGHRQTTTASTSGRHRESSVSQASDSDGSYEDAGRQTVTTHGRSGSSSRHQHGASHGQAGDSSRHSASHQGQRDAHRESDSVHGEQGHRHEQQGGQLHTQGLDTDKPQLRLLAVDTGNPVLARRVTATAPMKMQGDKLSRHQHGASHGQAGDSSRHSASHQGQRGAHRERDSVHGEDRGTHRAARRQLPDTQGLDTDKPQLRLLAVDTGNPVLARRVTATAPMKRGRQTVTTMKIWHISSRARGDTERGTLSTESLEAALARDRGTAMSSKETAPDTQGRVWTKLNCVSHSRPRESSVSQASDSDGSYEDAGRQTVTTHGRSRSSSVSQYGASHGQGGDSLGTQRLIKAKRCTRRVTLSTESLEAAWPQHTGRHQQERDNSRHSRTGYGQSSAPLWYARHRDSSTSHSSDRQRIQKIHEGNLDCPQKIWSSSRHNMGLPMARQETALGTQRLIKGKEMHTERGTRPRRDRDRHEQQGDSSRHLRDWTQTTQMRLLAPGECRETNCDHPLRLGPVQGTNMGLPMGQQETALGTQRLIKGKEMHTERVTCHGEDRGTAMSSKETAPDTQGLDTDKPQLRLLGVDTGNPVLARRVTATAPMKMQGDKLSRHQHGVPMAKQGTALGTQHSIKGKEVHTERGTLSTARDRGTAMSSKETAPDTQGLDTDKPQLRLLAVDTGNPVLARRVTATAPMKMQGDKLSRHQHGASHGQAGDSSRHSALSRAKRCTQREGLCPRRTGARHEPAKRQLQTQGLDMTKLNCVQSHQASDSDGSYEDAGRQTVTTHGRSRSSSVSQYGASHGQGGDSSRHSASVANNTGAATAGRETHSGTQGRDMGKARLSLVLLDTGDSIRDTNMGLPMARQETALGTQRLIKGKEMHTERVTLSTEKSRGTAMSSKGDSSRHSGTGHRQTTTASTSGRHRESVLARRDDHPWKISGPVQGTNMGLHGQAGDSLGTQRLIKGKRCTQREWTLSTERQGHRHEQQRDSSRHSGLDTDKPQLRLLAVDTGNPVLARRVTATAPMKMQGDKLQGTNMGLPMAKRDSSRHSASHQGQRGAHRERDSVHGEKGNLHEQQGDSSRHSGTGHRQTHNCVYSGRHRESSVSQASDSDGSYEDAGRQTVTTHGRSGSSSRHQHGASHGQAGDSSRHSASHQGAKRCTRERTLALEETGARHEQQRDSSDTQGLDMGKANVSSHTRQATGALHMKDEGDKTGDPPMERLGSSSGAIWASHGQGGDSSRHSASHQGQRGAHRETALANNTGAAISRKETTPGTQGPDMGKARLSLVLLDTGIPVPVTPVTAKGIQKIHEGNLRLPTEDLGPVRDTNMGLPMARQETALGTQRLIKGKEMHTERVTLSAGQRQGHRHEQQGDSSRHSGTGHRQTTTASTSGRHRESSVSQASDSDGSYEDAGRQTVTTHGRSGSSSRHQHGASHGQAGDSSRHSASHQGQRGAHRERDSVHGESGSSAGQRQGHRHEQQGDSSRHSGTGYGQSSTVSSRSRPRESSVRQSSDSEGHSENARRQTVTTHGRSQSSSVSQYGAAHDQTRDSLRHSDSHEGHRGTYRERDSVHGESGSSAGQRQGHHHEQQRGSSRHLGTAYGQSSTVSSRSRPRESSVSQASDSDGCYEDAGRQTLTTHARSGSSSRHQHGLSHGQEGDSSRHSASHQGQRVAHRESDSVHGESGSSAGQRRGHLHEQQRDSSRHSGTGHRQTSTASGSSRHRESSVSQASDSDGSYEDAGRITLTTHARSGSSSRHQHGASHGQAGVSSTHSESQQRYRPAPTERDSVQGEDRGTAMSSKETAPDTQGVNMDKAQLCSVAIDTDCPELVMLVTVLVILKLLVDS